MKIVAMTAADSNNRTKTYSPIVAFCFSINFIVGSGFLAVPFVFWHTGIVAGLATLAVVTFFISIPAFWTLETMARAQVSEIILTAFYTGCAGLDMHTRVACTRTNTMM